MTEECKPSTSEIKMEIPVEQPSDETLIIKDSNEIMYFNCDLCGLRQRYEYFGNSPPFYRGFKLQEEAYVIEDPFIAPKQGEILILGAHCIHCQKMVCKDSSCSLYYAGTHCINCIKDNVSFFPKVIQDKLNRIVV
ncbi:cysteine-rich DPF motif domain-containing protein 1 [Euwallacea similis]|uniref:cysteine-rich DPF motif domain-containing protein 1 n=1 Tax=Euwallacea similis TaxID=1736056 RepID=UPI00344F5DDA